MVDEWTCDLCGNPMRRGQGQLIADTTTNGGPLSNIRIVHRSRSKALCQPPALGFNVPIDDLLTPDGLSSVLSWVCDGPDGVHVGRARGASLSEIVDVIRRLYLPGYETARPYLNDKSIAQVLQGDELVDFAYTTSAMRRIHR